MESQIKIMLKLILAQLVISMIMGNFIAPTKASHPYLQAIHVLDPSEYIRFVK